MLLDVELDGLHDPDMKLLEVRACVWQPGRSGTDPTIQPSSSFSRTTLNEGMVGDGVSGIKSVTPFCAHKFGPHRAANASFDVEKILAGLRTR
jgi:hypothetical protein